MELWNSFVLGQTDACFARVGDGSSVPFCVLPFRLWLVRRSWSSRRIQTMMSSLRPESFSARCSAAKRSTSCSSRTATSSGRAPGCSARARRSTRRPRSGLTNEDRLIFLGYPDGLVFDMRDEFRFGPGAPARVAQRDRGDVWESRSRTHRLSHHRFGSPALYSWTNVVGDMTDILNTFVRRTSSRRLNGISTWITKRLLPRADGRAQRDRCTPGYNPTVHKTTVWPGDDSWPLAGNPTTYFTQIPKPPFRQPARGKSADLDRARKPRRAAGDAGELGDQRQGTCDRIARHPGRA